MERATRLGELKRVLAPQPLDEADLAAFFVETSGARDAVVSRRDDLASRLEGEGDTKVLLASQWGSGKSTELVKFRAEHRDRFEVFHLDVRSEHLLGNVHVEALLVLIAETVLAGARASGAELSERGLRSVHGWFAETFQEDMSEREATFSAGAGVDTKETVWSKLTGLFGFLKNDIRAGCKTLNKTITKENRRLSELVFFCDLLIRDARLAVAERSRKEMLLVAENLDKITISEGNGLFVENPAPLASLSCKAIYTAPLSVLCSPRSSAFEGSFETLIIPMIKVTERDGSACQRGRGVIREILNRRFATDTLVEPDALEFAIERTGGVLRHLFEVLPDAERAVLQAVKRGERSAAAAKITKPDVRWGLDQRKSALIRRLGVIGLPPGFEKITIDDIYARLRELVGKTQTRAPDAINLLLMQAHALVEYNGESWCRLHPLIEEHVKESSRP